MPALIAYGRKWNIASDDFVFPEITEAFARLLWMAFFTAVYVLHFPLECTREDLVLLLPTLFLINAVTVILAFSIAVISSRGAIMSQHPRRHVATLLYIRLPVFVLEVIVTIASTVSVFLPGPPDATCYFLNISKLVVGFEWVLLLSVLVGVFLVFNPNNENDIEDSMTIARRTWSRRFKIFTIYRKAPMRDAIEDFASLMGSFFADIDLVFSDVAAGLFLVAHSPINIYPPVVPASTASQQWMTVENALHFLYFSSCAYGWPAYLLHNCSFKSFYHLLRKMHCCGTLRCNQVMILEDNCCLCNVAAIRLSMEKKNVDISFVSFRNDLYEVPFVVFADHETRSIVITIRGSCSLVDLVTDLCLDDEVLSIDVDADAVLRQDTDLNSEGEVRVHRGMLMSARYVFDTLRKHQVLSDLTVLNPDYQLVVCGHSLGAAVASLLTLLLKQQYPNVRCFSFAPPGCVINENGQHEMEQHVMSIISGDDVVSRISFHALQRLRMKVVAELDACSKAKYEILIRGIFRLFFNPTWESGPLSGNGDVTDRDNLIMDNGVANGTYGTTVDAPSNATAITLSTNQVFASRVELFAPGKLLYIAEDSTVENGVKCQWIDAKCLSDVKLTASAFTDHLPKSIERMLEKIVAVKATGVPVDAVINTPDISSTVAV